MTRASARHVSIALAGLAAVLLLARHPALAEVINRLPSREKIVALTFDACPTKAPSHLDRKILDFLVEEKLPATIFASGEFAQRDRKEFEAIAKYGFIEVENHSYSHPMHMERLSPDRIRQEVLATDALLTEITGRKPLFFRFPAGNYDARALEVVESLGYRTVHWTFASGDPARSSSAAGLYDWVTSRTAPGSILIFHINGRGWRTGEALPRIVAELKRRGYSFGKLSDLLH